MIVVSGALVLVALIFLIIGLLGEGLGMIWASIGTSLVAGVFLLLGALQRRGQAPTVDSGTTSSADMMERVTAVSVKPREEAASDAPAEEAAPAAAASGGGQVSIVPGRPRYHVASCRFLAGRPDVEQVDVEQARSDGFTACGVCKPDAALAAADTASEPEVTEDTTVEDLAPTLAAPDAAPAKKAPAKRTRTAAASGSAGTAATAALEAPADDSAGDTAAAEVAAAAPAKPARKAAAKPAAAAAKPAAKAASSGAGASTVVVVPDRGKFHVETCRFVKDVPGTVTLSKTTAKRQGYAPCGVCKP